MTDTVAARLEAAGITLPPAGAVAGNYVPWVRTGDLLFISGQLPLENGTLQVAGRLGEDLGLEDGQRAARLCALNLIAQVKAALDGDLERVTRIVRLGGYVNSTPDFTAQPKVINGASDLMAEIFGDAGQHSRAAVACPSLPLGAAVELDGVVEAP